MALMPLLLFMASVGAGVSNYREAKEDMRQDLNHALRQLVAASSQKQSFTDSLLALHHGRVLTLSDAQEHFSERLTIHSLRDTSHVSVCLLSYNDGEAFREKAFICSDTLLWYDAKVPGGDTVVALKAYANPSFCSVLWHSGQLFPFSGLICSLLLLSLLAWRCRWSRNTVVSPALAPAEAQETVCLTPMQEQLMEMFDSAPGHTLSKEAICAALWPKKDHPETTLYTFICRLKTKLKTQTDMDIINKRGREYQLVKRQETD